MKRTRRPSPHEPKVVSNGRALKLDLALGTRAWAPPRSRMSTWAAAALGKQGEGREIAIRIVAMRESRALNKMWRGKDKPTNVLSFPAPPGFTGQGSRRAKPKDMALPLGDLVICA